MKLLITLILSFLFTITALAQQDNYWLIKCTDTNQENCGYADRAGNYKIPPGKYNMCFTDTFREMAIVLDSGIGFIAINRDCKKLFEVFPFDNGPDNISEDLYRIIDNNKIGFADMQGNIVIKPSFKFVGPFSNGLAAFSNTCSFTKDTDGEHTSIVGGKWGYIDKSGKIVIEPKYEKVQPFFNEEADVKLNGKDITIDKTGKIIK